MTRLDWTPLESRSSGAARVRRSTISLLDLRVGIEFRYLERLLCSGSGRLVALVTNFVVSFVELRLRTSARCLSRLSILKFVERSRSKRKEKIVR